MKSSYHDLPKTGHLKYFGDLPGTNIGFLLPIFVLNGETQLFIQDADRRGLIIGFRTIDIDDAELIGAAEKISVSIGEEVVLAFRDSSNPVFVGSRISVTKYVLNFLKDNHLANAPFLRASLARFCSRSDIELEADTAAVQKIKSKESRDYYTLGVLCRDLIRNHLPDRDKHQQFRVVRNSNGIKIELPQNVSLEVIQVIEQAANLSQSDIKKLLGDTKITLNVIVSGVYSYKTPNVPEHENAPDTDIKIVRSILTDQITPMFNKIDYLDQSIQTRQYIDRVNVLIGHFIEKYDFKILLEIFNLVLRVARRARTTVGLREMLVNTVISLFNEFPTSAIPAILKGYALYVFGTIQKEIGAFFAAEQSFREGIGLYESSYDGLRHVTLIRDYALLTESLSRLLIQNQKMDDALDVAFKIPAAYLSFARNQHRSYDRQTWRALRKLILKVGQAGRLDAAIYRTDAMIYETKNWLSIVGDEGRDDLATQLELLSHLKAEQGAAEEALSLLKEALFLRDDISNVVEAGPRNVARTTVLSALIYVEINDEENAIIFFERAADILRNESQLQMSFNTREMMPPLHLSHRITQRVIDKYLFKKSPIFHGITSSLDRRKIISSYI